MAVSMYFGLPGAGKTTLLASFAVKAMKSKRYKHVYCNVHLNIDGIQHITPRDLMVYAIEDGLILFDEASVDFFGRNYKQLQMNVVEYFLLHRHARVDICVFSQANNIDKVIRSISDHCYYIYKPLLTGLWFTKYYRIPFDMILPKKEKTAEGNGDGSINFGYYRPSGLSKLFAKRIFRPRWYRYYDSWAFPKLPALPEERTFHKQVKLPRQKGESRKKRA